MQTNQYPQQSSGLKFKTITIIHTALLAGQVLFGIVASTITVSHGFNLKYTGDPFLIVVPVMAISSFIASNFLFKQQLAIAVNGNTLDSKLTRYLTAMIIRCALLEGASLFGIVTFLLTGNLLFITISGLIVLYFISFRPTKDKIETDLNLTYEEKLELDN